MPTANWLKGKRLSAPDVGGGLVIKDLDSVNGVYVDGAQIDDKTPLSTGAVIRIGSTTAIFEET